MKNFKRFLCAFMTFVLLCTAFSVNTVSYAYDNSQKNTVVNFGSYPQSQVKDSNLLLNLNKLKLNWNSYDYYVGKNAYNSMAQSNFMKYADVSYKGARYRAVTFNQYRPDSSIGLVADALKAQQYKNGFEVNKMYWFKYEPIKWHLLDDKNGLMLSVDILDAQPFSNTVYEKAGEYYNNSDCSVYVNDYYTSSVRQWLNRDFYNCAFSEKEKTCIKTSSLNNEAYSSDYKKFDSAKSNDKVFLLSYKDVMNASYGFNPDKYSSDALRIASGSDYSKCQGLFVETQSGAESNSYWSLRTAGSESIFSARVSPNGIVSNNSYVHFSCYAGIRPAICVNLKSCVLGLYEPNKCSHSFSSAKIIKKANCTGKGQKEYACTLCSYKYTEPIKAYGHKYKAKVVKPTYFSTGYTLHTCSLCKKSYKDKKTAKLKVKTPKLKKLTTKNKSVKASWTKIKSVQGYEIQYSTDKKFKRNTKIIKIKKGSAVSKTIKKLKKNKKYYIRVRAYKYQNKKYARSSWSNVKSIKVK